MRLDQPFDPTQHEPTAEFEPIPAGWYAMRILSTEVKATKSGAGKYLELQLEVDSAHHPNIGARRVFDRLNLWNPNAAAVDIANRTLSAICYALGLKSLEDTDQLCGQLLAVQVKVREATAEYAANNEVKLYDALDNRITKSGAAPAAPAATAQPSPAASEGKPPWQR